MLYSTAVYIEAKEDIRFKYYETEALHGLLFNILGKSNPEFTDEMHDQMSKQFTLSNFMPFTRRQGSAKILEKGREYKFRVTFLDEELLNIFLRYFMRSSEQLRLNGVEIQSTKILTVDNEEPWCCKSTFADLLEGRVRDSVKLKFLTATSFRRGERNVILPTPELVFGSLLARWNAAGGPKLTLQEEELAAIEVSQYELKSRLEQFRDYSIKGFTGECEYWFGNLSDAKQREVMALARFAFYAGVGYKTTMGLGQVARVD